MIIFNLNLSAFISCQLQILYCLKLIFFSVGVFCVSDGWASAANDEFVFTYASIYVQAWIFDSSEIVFTQTDTRGSGINVSPTITMPKPFDIDTHLFLVRVSYHLSALTY